MHYIKVVNNEDGSRDIYVMNPQHETVFTSKSMPAIERKINTLNGGLGLVPHEYFAAQAIAGLAASGKYTGNPAALAEDALATGGYMVDLMNRKLREQAKKNNHS